MFFIDVCAWSCPTSKFPLKATLPPSDWFTLRNNLSYIYDFVYESLLLSPLYVKLPVTVKSPFMVVFPHVKIKYMAVSLYNVIVLVADNPMYEKSLTFKYILANDSSVLKSIIGSFAVNCVSAKVFKSSSLIISYFATSKYIGF